MHDIWNPWHGCHKCSEGCQYCYMYTMDQKNGRSGAEIYRTKTGFSYPLQKDRRGQYKIRSSEMLRVCMTSDFFLPEADPWREDAWDMIRMRPDVIFVLLTKRPQRVSACLPEDWGDGWENVFFHVACENQTRAEERIPLLLSLPFRHKGVFCTPLLGPISLRHYLQERQIEQVVCGGENYAGSRPCDYAWVKHLRAECETFQVSFCFFETGTQFIKDGKRYHLPEKRLQSRMAAQSGISYSGASIQFHLTDRFGLPIPQEQLYRPHYRAGCSLCGSKPICNGCADCKVCRAM